MKIKRSVIETYAPRVCHILIVRVKSLFQIRRCKFWVNKQYLTCILCIAAHVSTMEVYTVTLETVQVKPYRITLMMSEW